MNCDEVFVILTRGPFPSGSPHDRRVEAHLKRCVDCQRLAEALRPNDDSLHESVGLDEGGALPGYWGDPLGAAGDLAVSLTDSTGSPTLKQVRNRSMRSSQTKRNLNVWQFAAAVALGIVVAAALKILVAGHPSRSRFISSAGAGEANGDARSWSSNSDEPASLLNLPAICRGIDTPDSSKPLAPISFADLPALRSDNCCTVCHHAGSATRISDVAKIRLEHSCQACH